MTMIETRERPILFSGPMVRAILDGRKTQTRRVVKWANQEHALVRLRDRYAAPVRDGIGLTWIPFGGSPEVPMPPEKISELSPYGSLGDRLWVRETWATEPQFDNRAPADIPATAHDVSRVLFAGGFVRSYHKLRPSIHMPRWASRLTLEITGVRVERLQVISEDDARAEGVKPSDACIVFQAINSATHRRAPDLENTARGAYACLWDALNAKRGYGWDVNPWVWVISFKVAA